MNEHESSCFLDVTVRETFETNLNSNHIILENGDFLSWDSVHTKKVRKYHRSTGSRTNARNDDKNSFRTREKK